MRNLTGLLFTLVLLCSTGCDPDDGSNKSTVNGSEKRGATATPAAASAEQIPIYGYEVVNIFPHDPLAFTQGIIFQNGVLIESTGLEGHSTLRRVELQTGRVIQSIDVPKFYFAEGMTLFAGKIYQLTWKGAKGFVYDPETFQKTGEFSYTGEGWGLTHDADSLILSDGSEQIRFIDPSTYKVKRTISVLDHGRPLQEINELEYVKGEIYANVWHQNRVARIDPQTGHINGWIDLSGLLRPGEVTDPDAVLNGIAYDEQGDRLFITGKLWPKLFEIRLKQK
ncbi:MAG: glutaminyl-peptide cyclotransferase [Acidobacteriota bacterium]|jgi:glutamine cyclotransferase|nr:glutaminyl-peptide cyclotransferase [Acidobacteriota bacterium]